MKIYQLIIRGSGKTYVGKTEQSLSRIRRSYIDHAKKPNTSKTLVHEDIIRFGQANVYVRLLEECPDHLAYERKEWWAETLNAFTPNGYNERRSLRSAVEAVQS